jgi:hypothetical protein
VPFANSQCIRSPSVNLALSGSTPKEQFPKAWATASTNDFSCLGRRLEHLPANGKYCASCGPNSCFRGLDRLFS